MDGKCKNNGESLVLTSEWECFYNIPSAITSVIGGDYWVSPDLKWLFYISLSGANYQGFSKGLHTIKGSSALLEKMVGPEFLTKWKEEVQIF